MQKFAVTGQQSGSGSIGVRLTVQGSDWAMKNDARIGYTGRPGMPNWPENRELLTSQQPDEVKIPFSLNVQLTNVKQLTVTSQCLLFRKLEMSSSCGMLSAL